jgi:hypothetical protein
MAGGNPQKPPEAIHNNANAVRDPMSNAKNAAPKANGKLKRDDYERDDPLARRIGEAAAMGRAKRQERGDYKEADYPFRIIPEVF